MLRTKMWPTDRPTDGPTDGPTDKCKAIYPRFFEGGRNNNNNDKTEFEEQSSKLVLKDTCTKIVRFVLERVGIIDGKAEDIGH